MRIVEFCADSFNVLVKLAYAITIAILEAVFLDVDYFVCKFAIEIQTLLLPYDFIFDSRTIDLFERFVGIPCANTFGLR